MAFFNYISPLSSTILAPAVNNIGRDLAIVSVGVRQMTFSGFVLAYAFGPLFLGPMSEIYGRPIVLQISNLFYLVFNTAAGFSHSAADLIAFRFLSGLGASAPLSVR